MTALDDEPVTEQLLASIAFRTQPHKRAEVLSAVDEVTRRMRQARGCARARLLADAEDPNSFLILSEWLTSEDADVFFSSRDLQLFRGIRILLRDEPVILLQEVRSQAVRLMRASNGT
jgi:quinol monooxygenase YgiN